MYLSIYNWMEAHRKLIRTVWWVLFLGVCLLLVVLYLMQSLDKKTMIVWLMIAYLIVAAVEVAVKLLWNRGFVARANELLPILTVERNADRYIAETRTLMAGKKSPQLLAMLNNNLARAYCEKHEFVSAKDCLTQAIQAKIPQDAKHVCQLNLCYVLFRLGEHVQALALMAQSREAQAKFQDSSQLGALVAILRVSELAAQGKKEEAHTLLASSAERWRNAQNDDDFTYLEARCEEL